MKLGVATNTFNLNSKFRSSFNGIERFSIPNANIGTIFLHTVFSVYIYIYIYITSKHKIDLLHKNFIHYKFVSYGKREACHTRQVNVASGVISVKLEMFVW